MEPDGPVPADRMGRRKAATRARIAAAANELFERRGYAATSMEDIANQADVGIRTIYLHFDSKAAIFLAHFDAWLTAFVDGILERPPGEPVGDAVAAAVARLAEQGWSDPTMAETAGPPPMLEFIGDGPPDIAGHVLHSWVAAQDRIAAETARQGGLPEGDPAAYARAAAVYAAWTATILIFRAGHRGSGLARDVTGNQVGARIAWQFGDHRI
ncbi:MAG: helix-turn-helix transcriptional regulator [Microbacteriaceae bacterium]|nr:helix-turn-helix transcriptional regulator [Microbacteriaceae bacterium]